MQLCRVIGELPQWQFGAFFFFLSNRLLLDFQPNKQVWNNLKLCLRTQPTMCPSCLGKLSSKCNQSQKTNNLNPTIYQITLINIFHFFHSFYTQSLDNLIRILGALLLLFAAQESVINILSQCIASCSWCEFYDRYTPCSWTMKYTHMQQNVY